MNIAELQRRAESGSVIAQTALGVCYLDGIGVEVDYEKALRLLLAAAEKGASRAIANLARMYAEGLGIPENLTEGVRLYEVAANTGEFFAQVELGRIYAMGRGVVAANLNEARRWYSAAAAQEEGVGDCEEIREAKAYIARPS